MASYQACTASRSLAARLTYATVWLAFFWKASLQRTAWRGGRRFSRTVRFAATAWSFGDVSVSMSTTIWDAGTRTSAPYQVRPALSSKA
jgi:L-aminopeptidase/D-esterase-like protein